MRSPQQLAWTALRTGIGISACAAAAALVAVWSPPLSSWIPLGFVLVVLLVARWCGTAAGLVGSLVAAVIFAIWLYTPIGSLAVQNQKSRMDLGWMILAGISLSFLLARPPKPGNRQPH